MKYDSTTNIIVLGESDTGKTTLIYNYLYKNLNLYLSLSSNFVLFFKNS